MEKQLIVSRDFGFFSNLYSVIGALDYCEKHSKHPVVMFDSGAYLDLNRGPNWWLYYFEPSKLLSCDVQLVTTRAAHEQFSNEMALTLLQDRDRTAQLIEKYIHVKEPIKKRVEEFIGPYKHAYIIGIHIRGTDKYNEVPPIDMDRYITTVQKIAKGRPAGSWKLFVATDEQAILNTMMQYFGDAVIYNRAIRSSSSKAVHARSNSSYGNRLSGDYQYQIGLEALTEMITLSSCDIFVGCQSNLSFFAAAYNIDIPWINLAPSSHVINTTIHADLLAKEKVIQELVRERKTLLEKMSRTKPNLLVRISKSICSWVARQHMRK